MKLRLEVRELRGIDGRGGGSGSRCLFSGGGRRADGRKAGGIWGQIWWLDVSRKDEHTDVISYTCTGGQSGNQK